jgi:hypothetical protein
MRIIGRCFARVGGADSVSVAFDNWTALTRARCATVSMASTVSGIQIRCESDPSAPLLAPRGVERRLPTIEILLLEFWSRRADLNRGPADYEFSAWSRILRNLNVSEARGCRWLQIAATGCIPGASDVEALYSADAVPASTATTAAVGTPVQVNISGRHVHGLKTGSGEFAQVPSLGRFLPRAIHHSRADHWGFQVDLPANHLGPGWRKRA